MGNNKKQTYAPPQAEVVKIQIREAILIGSSDIPNVTEIDFGTI